MSTPANAPYKVRNHYYKQRARQCIMHSPLVGGKYWAADGQGYQRMNDGSIRRINEPAPVGLLARIRGMFRA